MMKITLLDTATLGGTSLDAILQLGNVTQYELTSPDQVVERCSDCDAIITNKVVISRESMEKLPNLKLICVAATGTNNIDLTAAKELGIAVTNVAGYSTPSVVQHTFALITNLLGNTHRYAQDCQQGAWQKSEMFCRLDYSFDDMSDKTLAIIGHGSLGQQVKNVAHAFGLKVILAERKGATPRAGRVEFYKAIQEADIISLHCPLTTETKDLITMKELSMMKSTSLLINTARGGIVNEADLVDALQNNIIAGAGFDVLSKEPAEASNPLAQYKGDNLLLTPHVAWASRQSITRLVAEIALNIQAFQQGEKRGRLV